MDKNGTVHIVWSHELETNFNKIYYSFSEDDGLTWSEPEDISLNNSKTMGNPHIVADTNNILYVTYEENMLNYYKTVVVMKSCTEGFWSDFDTVSTGQQGAGDSKLEIDNKNRVYSFWTLNSKSFYKYYENGSWSDLLDANEGLNDKIYIQDIVADNNNVLHCLFTFYYSGQTSDSTIVTYKNLENNSWSEMEIVGGPTKGKNAPFGIDVDTFNMPHIAYREIVPGQPPYNDTTVYRYKNETGWSPVEVIVTDPYNQKILIDENNKPNVFDIEKLGDDGSMLVHHFKEYSWWESIIIDEVELGTIHYSVYNKNNQLYTTYCKFIDEILFSKTGLLTITGQKKKPSGIQYKIVSKSF